MKSLSQVNFNQTLSILLQIISRTIRYRRLCHNRPNIQWTPAIWSKLAPRLHKWEL